MNIVNPYRFGTPTYNTMIGGEGGVITSAADLASVTSLSTSNISNFNIDADNNITCYINSSYTIDNDAFYLNTTLSYYIDLDGLVTEIGDRSFLSAGGSGTKFLSFPNLTTVNGLQSLGVTGAGTYHSSEIIALPKCTTLGSTVLTNNIFLNNFTSLNLYVDSSLSTINSGTPDDDLDVAFLSLSYTTDLTAPDAIDDLTVDVVLGTGISISWTAPTSTNAIDFYIVFANNNYIGYTSSLNYNITNLELSTSYDIKILVVDEMGNVSDFSNEVTQTTDATYDIPTGNIISYYDLDTDSTDQVGTNDGSDTSISYVSGLISNCADFTASTASQILIADDDTLSFGNGTTDSAFSISFWFKYASTGNVFFFEKRNTNGTQGEYIFFINTNNLRIRCIDASTGGYIDIYKNVSTTTGVWYHCVATYNGNGSYTGLNVYFNTSNTNLVNGSSGSYTAMENGTGDISVGKFHNGTTFSLNGYMDEIAIFDKELSYLEVFEIYNKNQAGYYLTEV